MRICGSAVVVRARARGAGGSSLSYLCLGPEPLLCSMFVTRADVTLAGKHTQCRGGVAAQRVAGGVCGRRFVTRCMQMVPLYLEGIRGTCTGHSVKRYCGCRTKPPCAILATARIHSHCALDCRRLKVGRLQMRCGMTLMAWKRGRCALARCAM